MIWHNGVSISGLYRSKFVLLAQDLCSVLNFLRRQHYIRSQFAKPSRPSGKWSMHLHTVGWTGKLLSHRWLDQAIYIYARDTWTLFAYYARFSYFDCMQSVVHALHSSRFVSVQLARKLESCLGHTIMVIVVIWVCLEINASGFFPIFKEIIAIKLK